MHNSKSCKIQEQRRLIILFVLAEIINREIENTHFESIKMIKNLRAKFISLFNSTDNGGNNKQ